jgi:hypothetical protein
MCSIDSLYPEIVLLPCKLHLLGISNLEEMRRLQWTGCMITWSLLIWVTGTYMDCDV